MGERYHVSAQPSVLGTDLESSMWIASSCSGEATPNQTTPPHNSRFKMADKMEGVVMGGGLVDPSKYPVPIET